ncbi:hypothetical protein OIDMADRAFT_133611 [Oidiodendron maius Zn]|uniref:1-alkyl-2-acetylglycerophosphocholine esterase n=1 Tax=Oidiodendron maius (strain Zn) TaxID=913774 RepID=A0A0C3C9Y9_OIDMZ|nr:hypothetical protein OIDMADRAFT_133611 [Oidiodendron maius Zn]
MSLGPVHAQNTTLPPIVVPTPPGPYATRMEIKVIVDTSHPDPYNSTLKYNRILTSIYTPVSKSLCLKFCEEQYYPPATAAFADTTLDAHGVFERLTLSLCCSIYSSPGRIFHDDEYPVLILTPGFRESRLDFSVFAQYLSSYGYKVILMEQPGEPNIVEFPDGEIVRSVFGITPTDADEVLALNVQVQDILFIIDQFTKGKELTEQVNYIAAQAMLNDSLNGHPGRIAGGVNLDGTYYGAVLTEGMGSGKKFFMLWDNIDHNSLPGPNNEPSFTQWWNITDRLDNQDWRVELSLTNSTKATFTDLPLLADISGVRQTDPGPVDSLIGTINGVRSMSIETVYISDFFDMALKGKKETLLSGPNKAYLEVAFVRLETS